MSRSISFINVSGDIKERLKDLVTLLLAITLGWAATLLVQTSYLSRS